MTFSPDLLAKAERVLGAARAAGQHITTAESCTGGLIFACLTEIAGSSDVVGRGFITYSNDSKVDLLGVPNALLAEHGAVSEEVARAMAAGALTRSDSQISVAVTGVAGPGGGTQRKPVGLVHVAGATADGKVTHERHEFGDLGRGEIRLKAVDAALGLLLVLAGN